MKIYFVKISYQEEEEGRLHVYRMTCYTYGEVLYKLGRLPKKWLLKTIGILIKD